MTVSANNNKTNNKKIKEGNKETSLSLADTGVEVVFPLNDTSTSDSAVECIHPLAPSGPPSGPAPLNQSNSTALSFFLRDSSLPRILCKFCEMPTLDGSFFHPRCRAIVEAYVECDGVHYQKFLGWLEEENA